MSRDHKFEVINGTASKKTAALQAKREHPSSAAASDAQWWFTLLGVRYPADHIFRHPKVLDAITSSVVSCRPFEGYLRGVRLGFQVPAESEEQARDRSEIMERHILKIIGLSPDDIVEREFSRAPDPFPSLTIMQGGATETGASMAPSLDQSPSISF